MKNTITPIPIPMARPMMIATIGVELDDVDEDSVVGDAVTVSLIGIGVAAGEEAAAVASADGEVPPA